MKYRGLFNIISRPNDFKKELIPIVKKLVENEEKLSEGDKKRLLLPEKILKEIIECTGSNLSMTMKFGDKEKSLAIWQLRLEFIENVLPAFKPKFDLGRLELWLNEILLPDYEFNVDSEDLFLLDPDYLYERNGDLFNWLTLHFAKELVVELTKKGLKGIPLCPNELHPFISFRERKKYCSRACYMRIRRKK
jgi:hypothetical protein